MSHSKPNADGPHIVFAGGGTGGHLFPGLAVAEQLREMLPNARITIATGRKPLERDLVAAAGFRHLRLPSSPVPQGPRSAWRFVADNLSGYRAARRFLRTSGVSVVVGLGGYASVPMAWGAVAARIPLVLLAQNAVPGRATRWFAPRAALVCAAMEQVRPLLKAGGPIRVTGNPIRAGFSQPADAATRSAAPERQLLVLGGSGGSRALNEQVPRALYKLRSRLIDWRIVHQCGPRDWHATDTLYRKLAVEAVVVPFLDPIQPVLHDTDLVVCRAGGTTLAELAAAGLPAVLVPYPDAAADHQRKNADIFAAAGAARIVDCREITGRLDDALATAMADLLVDAAERARMAAPIRGLARPDAAWQVATMISDLVYAGRPPLAVRPASRRVYPGG